MVALQTLLALYRFGDSTALLQLVNPLMWIGLGLFFVTGWVIGWVVERLLRGTAGRFRTLLLGATFLATPVAVAGSLVGGLFGPPGVLLYGLIPYLLPSGDFQTDWGRVDPAWLLSFRKQSTNNSRRCRTSHQVDRPPDSERTWAGRPPYRGVPFHVATRSLFSLPFPGELASVTPRGGRAVLAAPPYRASEPQLARAVSEERRRERDPHRPRRPARRRPHRSGGRVVAGADSAPLHRGRPRRRHRGMPCPSGHSLSKSQL